MAEMLVPPLSDILPLGYQMHLEVGADINCLERIQNETMSLLYFNSIKITNTVKILQLYNIITYRDRDNIYIYIFFILMSLQLFIVRMCCAIFSEGGAQSSDYSN